MEGGGSKSCFCFPQCPDWLCDPSSLLSAAYGRQLPHGESGIGVKLTTHVRQVLRLSMMQRVCTLFILRHIHSITDTTHGDTSTGFRIPSKYKGNQ
jgi:hypothetical protein